MTVRMPSYQSGFELGQFLFIAMLLVLVSITGLKLVPAYIEDGKIRSIFASIAHDSDMQNASAKDIQNAFSRRSSIDDITAIQPGDIEIGRDNGQLLLSASYSIKVPLAGNISFLLEFNPSSEK